MRSEAPVAHMLLVDVCSDVAYGYTESATNVPIGPKFLRITDIQGGRFDWSNVPFCSASPDSVRKFGLKIGDIVVARTGNSTGENAQIWTLCEPAVFASYLIRFRVDPKKANPFFVGYQLRSERYRQYVMGVRGGSAQPGANAKQLGAFELLLPDRSHQDESVDLLRSIDARVDLLRQTNATLEAIAQALFKSWFIDFDPVRAKAEGREPEDMDAATAALFPAAFEDSPLGPIPAGWRIDQLGNRLVVLETGRRPKGGVSGIEKGVPSIGAESVTRVGHFDFGKTKYVSEEFFGKMRTGKLMSFDVLLYKDGGKPGIFLPRVSLFGDGFPFEKCAINEHVFRLRLEEPLGQVYLYFSLWSDRVMHELRHRGGKAAIPGINQSDVKEQMLLVPSAEVSKAFNVVVEPVFSKILANCKAIRSLVELRDTLLPRLISGRLRVPEAREQIEEALA